MAQRPYNPNLLITDDGQMYGPNDRASLRRIGLDQEDQRRRALDVENFRTGAGLRRSPRTVGHGNPAMAGYFGILQAKENAARAQGRNFNVDFRGKGPGTGFGVTRTQTLSGKSMPSPSMRALRGAAGGAGDPNDDGAQHWLNQALIRRANADASISEDAALDASFAEDPYKVQARGDMARAELGRNADAETSILRKHQPERDLIDAFSKIRTSREFAKAGQTDPYLVEDYNRQQTAARQTAAMRGLLGAVGSAFGKDPEAAGAIFDSPLAKTPLWQQTFGGGQGMVERPGDIDLSAGDTIGADDGSEPPMMDLVERTRAALQQRGIEPSDQNVATVLERQRRRMESATGIAPMASH